VLNRAKFIFSIVTIGLCLAAVRPGTAGSAQKSESGARC